MNALSGDTYVFAEVDGKNGVYTLRELYELHKQGRTIKVPTLLNEKGEKTWVEVEDAVSYGTQLLKRITLSASRLFVELTEDIIIPAYSPHLFSGREGQIKLNFKLVNELKVTQDPKYNDTLLLAMRHPLNIPEGEQTDWEIGFALGYFIAEGNLVYRKHKNTKQSLVTLNGLARKNGMTLEAYLNYMSDVAKVYLAVGSSDFKRGYVNILQKHFKFGKPHKVSENGYQLCSTDLDLIHLIKFYIEGHDSYTKHLKNEVYNRSWNFLEGVLAGFLSGDGYHDKKGDRFRVKITTNYRLYNDLIFLSKVLGYDAHINKGGVEKSNFSLYEKVYYKLRLSIFKNYHRHTAVGLVKERIKKIEDDDRKETFNLVLKPLYSDNNKHSVFNHLYFIAYGIMVSDAVKVFIKPL